jgi:transposase-like protein
VANLEGIVMPRSRHADTALRYRHFEQDIIVLCVRWYISYRLSYRDLVEMMAERGINVSPSTIYRWVPRFAGVRKAMEQVPQGLHSAHLRAH